MNKKDAYSAGRDAGWSVASWQDMPAIGETLSRDVDWQGIGEIATVTDQLDAWEILCRVGEEHGRQFSPFEVTASAINARPNSEAIWAAYDDGIEAGIRAYRRKHFPLRAMRKAAKGAAS